MGRPSPAALRLVPANAVHRTQDSQDSLTHTTPKEVGDRRWRAGASVREAVTRALAAERAGRAQHHRPLWSFTRELRAALGEMGGVEMLAAVEPVISNLGGWSAALGRDADDADEQLLEQWPLVRLPAGADPVAAAVEYLRAYPSSVLPTRRTDATGGKRWPAYERHVALAAWLQVVMGTGPILLPARRMAEALDCGHDMAAQRTRWALADGYITLVRPHSYGPRESRAAEYLFVDGRVGEYETLLRRARGADIEEDGGPPMSGPRSSTTTSSSTAASCVTARS